jgi:NADH-quinone oxidoreductase subunit M
MNNWLITCLILTPLIGAILVSLLPRSLARTLTLMVNAGAAGLAVTLWMAWNHADQGAGALQLVERHSWIPSMGAEYFVGVDGLSLLLVILTSLIIPFGLIAQKVDKPFCAILLVLQSALYGTFTAQNFILWFLFYEMSLIPSFLLIKIWGGHNRDKASTKFFVYTFFGSAAMLVSFLAIYLHAGTFDFVELTAKAKDGLVDPKIAFLVFAGVFLGFAVKVPLFPFHTWLPDAYESAPVGVSMVLTGILSKMGVYGFVRLVFPLFPIEMKAYGPILLTLAVCSIVFASLAAWAQKDLKRMVAYLSINHLGYCMLGVFALAAGSSSLVDKHAALGGVMLQIFNHGLTAATLFFFVGLLEKRRGSRGLNDFGGLFQKTPIFCGWMAAAMFSSLGLPGLNGFVSEFLIFKGAFALAAVPTAVATIGLLATAVVFLNAMQSLFSGPLSESCKGFPEITLGEKAIVIPVTALMLFVGVAPQTLLNIFNSTVIHMTK